MSLSTLYLSASSVWCPDVKWYKIQILAPNIYRLQCSCCHCPKYHPDYTINSEHLRNIPEEVHRQSQFKFCSFAHTRIILFSNPPVIIYLFGNPFMLTIARKILNPELTLNWTLLLQQSLALWLPSLRLLLGTSAVGPNPVTNQTANDLWIRCGYRYIPMDKMVTGSNHGWPYNVLPSTRSSYLLHLKHSIPAKLQIQHAPHLRCTIHRQISQQWHHFQ